MSEDIQQQILKLSQQTVRLYQQGRYEEAIQSASQARDLSSQYLGEDHPYFATSLNDLAALYYSMGNYTQAETLHRQAMEIRRKALGKDHPDFAQSLNNLALLYCSMGNYTQAEPLSKEAMEIRRKVIGEDHPDFATSLNNLAALYYSMGNYTQAEPLYRQAMEILCKAMGEDHPSFATSLNNLALLYCSMGNYTQAEPLYRQAMEIRRKAMGEDHQDFAGSLNNLAALYCSMGNYTQAEPLYRQAMEIRRKALGKDHPDFAQSLNNLALLYCSMGNYTQAETLYRQAMEILCKAMGEDHPSFATSLNNLAGLYCSMGNYTQAEPLYRQAMEILCKAMGEDHPSFATSLNNLAGLYYSMGNYTQAETLYRQAMEILCKAMGEDHPSFATSLNNLAGLYYSMGNYTQAETLYRQAMELRRKALGEDHPSFATSLNNLAGLYCSMGNYTQAETLYRQAMELRRKALGEDHPDFATSLNNLALLYYSMGNYTQAETLYRQAMELRRKALGEDHPDFATSLNNLALLYIATNRETEALPLMEQAASIDDLMIGQVFSIGSESQRMAYLKKVRVNLEGFISLVSQHLSSSPAAINSALELVLRRKAIGAEALAAQRDAVLGGRYPELEPELKDLINLRMQIAQKTLAGPGQEGLAKHQKTLSIWNKQKENLEAEMVRQIPEMNLEQKLKQIDRQAIASTLPEGAALIEFVRFDVLDFKAVPAKGESKGKPARYLAFVILAGEPDNVQMIDLGEARFTDKRLARFRDSVTGGPEETRRDLGVVPEESVQVPGNEDGVKLREAIFDKLKPALSKCKHLFISPDGELSRVPFEVLPNETGRFLIDDYHISYLGAGRDILRFGTESTGQPGGSLVIADPDFDLGLKKSGRLSQKGKHYGLQSRDLDRSNLHFEHLPGTHKEGISISKMMGVKPWLKEDALEARIKEYRSPRILHFATHGFFLKDQERDPNKEMRELDALGALGFAESGGMGRLSRLDLENPLLRSGLALAGVNTWLKGQSPPSDAEDGLLTAEDVTGLDLLDTELVVLSACETGLGEVRTGEGVFGLRRSFVLAGADTLVMSLWKVPDQQTQELMEEFYSRILAGEPRAEALKNAQMSIRSKHPHPFFWGAFICQGDPGPLPSG